ncbi:MAG: fibronectin type III domain-containing protein, partial [Candidatus Thermoplasmatota archaeon]|nr:fibronectin type III domain-containing protein [Candidatus Thermoplasmatota archaeon]
NPAGTMNIDQTDLTPGQNYYYSITAVNRLGESIRTQPLLVNYLGVSSRPRDLIAARGEGQIELKWIEPKVTWGLPIDSYYIYKGSGSGDTSLYKTVDGDVTSYTDIVMNGIDHTYEVSAVNSFGESKKAGPVTERASTRPAKITEISVSIGNSTVLLNWEPPQDGGAELSHYTVYRSLVETNPSELEKVPIGLEMLFDQGLTNGVAYYFRVTASNSNGEGPLSDPISATPGTDPLSVNQIKASPLLYSIRLNWQFPESGGRDIETFRIYRGTSISSMHSHMDITPDISTSEQEILDEELQYGTTYFYAVSSVNSMGESILSPIVSATPFGAPSAPKIRDIEIGLNEFSISWSAPLDNGKLPILGYRFYYKEADETEWDMVELEELMIRIPNKKAGDVFQIKVTAFNQLAEGFDSEIINIELGTEPEKMDAPTILGADSSCTLTWTEPEDNGHPILNYIIYMIDEKGIPQRWETMPAEENSFTAEDLLNGIEYTFKISAVNKMGEGPMSDQVSITPMTIPNEPGELYIEDSGDEFIIIKWTIPASNGGSEITEFNLYRGTTIGMGQSIGSVSGDVFEFIDHEVENGRTYHYLVSAVNILGEGPTSNLVSATPLGTPSTPMELKMSATTDTISIEWGKPVNNGGTPILGYVLYKGQNEDDMTVLNYLGPDEISFTDEDVETGTYYYSIQAYNEEGMGQPVTDSIEVPARIPTAAILGFGAFIIPLLIGIMAVVIPLMIARSKRKKEKEVKEAMEQTETKEAVEHTIEPAGPGLPGTGVQPPQVQVPRLEQPMSIAPERTLPPAQMPLQEPQMAPQPPAAYQQQQAPPMQPAPAPIQQERPPALTSDELTYQKPEK